MIRRLVFVSDVLRNFLGQGLPLRQPPAERLDKAFVALTAFGLCSRLRGIRQWWGDGQPEAHEQRQCFVRDGDVTFKPLHLSRPPVQSTPK